jgi:hypothetical protein
MMDKPNLPNGGSSGFPLTINSPPNPHQWTPKYIPDNSIYTYGSDIKETHRIGAACVYVPTRTAIYIDDGDTDANNTIMRAELVAINTALITFATHE